MNLLEKRRDVMLPPQEWRENRASRVGVATIGASYSATLMIYKTKTSSLNYVKCVKPSIASCNMLFTLSAVIFLNKILSFLTKKNRENFGKYFF